MKLLYRIFESEMEETTLFYDAIYASHFPFPYLCVLPWNGTSGSEMGQHQRAVNRSESVGQPWDWEFLVEIK